MAAPIEKICAALGADCDQEELDADGHPESVEIEADFIFNLDAGLLFKKETNHEA